MIKIGLYNSFTMAKIANVINVTIATLKMKYKTLHLPVKGELK